MKKKIIAALLTISMICSFGLAGAYAETKTQERVYVVASSDGDVISLTDTIQLQNEDQKDDITLRTLLRDIQNVSGEEAFTLDDETITWHTGGEDITWQGTSGQTPCVMPVVHLTLDGNEISAADLTEEKGEASLEVSFLTTRDFPTLAVAVVMLPEEGVTEIKTENAVVMTEAGHRMLVGWAVPGADEDLELPASFRADFQADQAELSWMMTVITSDPIHMICKEIGDRIDLDAHLELNEAKAVLEALKSGDEIPETTGKTSELGPKINGLNSGLVELNNGASELAEGTARLFDGAEELKDGTETLTSGSQAVLNGAAELVDGTKDLDDGAQELLAGADRMKNGVNALDNGASKLEAGLEMLTANSDTLNQGARMLFSAILDTANAEIASSGLEAAGINLPELTADNYDAVLTAILSQMDPDSPYPAMKAAYENLSGVKVQLDQVSAFVAGIENYTDGVAQVSDGASSLKNSTSQLADGASDLYDGVTELKNGTSQLLDGTQKLHDGLSELKDGAQKLSDGTGALREGALELKKGASRLQEDGTEKLLEKIMDAERDTAEKLLPVIENDFEKALRIFEETRDQSEDGGYDLRTESIETNTVYIIRTDLK